MDNLVPQAPSDAADARLQNRFNRDVNTSIRQMKDEIEARLSKVEKELADLIEEWREFYDVEWHDFYYVEWKAYKEATSLGFKP